MKAGKGVLATAILCAAVLTFAGCGGEKKESEPTASTVDEQKEPDGGQEGKEAEGQDTEKAASAAPEGETTILPDGTKMTVVEGENGDSMEIVAPDGETSVVPLAEMQGYLPNMQPEEMEIIALPENPEAALPDSSDAAAGLVELEESGMTGVLSDGTALLTLAPSGSPTVFENGAGNAAVLPVQTAADVEGESLNFSGGGDVEDSGVYVIKEYHLEEFQKNTDEFSAASYYANLERYETVRFELFGGRVEDVAFRYHTDFKQGEQVLLSDLLPEDMPVKKGYLFDGFYVMEDWGMRMLDPRDVFTESATVCAKWITEEESQAKLREAFANLPYQVGADSQAAVY